MKRRQSDSKTKAKIVLGVLSGRLISEICSQYQISQNQYYQWRDKFLAKSHRAFENGRSHREAKLKEEIATLERAYWLDRLRTEKNQRGSLCTPNYYSMN